MCFYSLSIYYGAKKHIGSVPKDHDRDLRPGPQHMQWDGKGGCDLWKALNVSRRWPGLIEAQYNANVAAKGCVIQ